MRKHNGMRPQDIVILLKIADKKEMEWSMKDLASELEISASEVSESLNRSVFSGLLMQNKKQIMKSGFLDFLKYGLKYVFPVKLGAMSRGMVTAYSAKPLVDIIQSSDKIVWAHPKGKERGMLIEPLIPSLPHACELEKSFYELVSLTDTLRIGRPREVAIAIEEMKKRI